MDGFNRPVQTGETTRLAGTGVLAGEKVRSRLRLGRHTITVRGSGRIGSEECVKAGGGFSPGDAPFTMPVVPADVDRLWYSGDIELTEWF